MSNLQRKTRLRRTEMSRSTEPALARTAFMFPCGPGWRTKEEAENSPKGKREGREQVHKCLNRACPKPWHVGSKPVPVKAVPSLRPRTGTGFPRSVKLSARKRAGGGEIEQARCEACSMWLGRLGGEIQHRLARGMGGCRSAVVNGLSNAGLLCHPCHGKAEARNPDMEAAGWWISSGKGPEHDPRYVPVMRMLASGERETVFLSEDGTYSAEGPERAAAA